MKQNEKEVIEKRSDEDITLEDIDLSEFAKCDINPIMRMYLWDIDEHPVISKEEEKELIIRTKNGDEEAEISLMEAYLRLVAHISKGYMGKGVQFDDLIICGNDGLIEAIKAYDPESGQGFSSYVSGEIRRSMEKAITDFENADYIIFDELDKEDME